MKKFFCCLLLIIIIFLGFNSFKRLHITDSLATDEQQIMALVVNITVPRDTTFKKLYLRDNSSYLFTSHDFSKIQTKQDSMVFTLYKQQKQKLDSISKVLDTSKIYVFLEDTLNKVRSVYLNSKVKDLKSSYYKTWDKDGIIGTWAREIKSPAYKLDLKKVNPDSLNHMFRYLFASLRKQLPEKGIVAGTIRMSSIFYNTKKTKAFVYSEFFRNYNYILERHILVEKRQDKWIIVKIMYDWGS